MASKFWFTLFFSGNASPVPGTAIAFNGTDIYTVADLPEIDYLFISHDHYTKKRPDTIRSGRFDYT